MLETYLKCVGRGKLISLFKKKRFNRWMTDKLAWIQMIEILESWNYGTNR